MVMRSPVSMKSGTVIVAPVSVVTCLVPPCAVLPRIDGGACVTVTSIFIRGLAVRMVSFSVSAVSVSPVGIRWCFGMLRVGIVIRSAGFPFGCITASSFLAYIKV